MTDKPRSTLTQSSKILTEIESLNLDSTSPGEYTKAKLEDLSKIDTNFVHSSEIENLTASLLDSPIQVEVSIPSSTSSSYSTHIIDFNTKFKLLKENKRTSYIKQLEISAIYQKEKFGLDNLHISTSPYEEEISYNSISPTFNYQQGTEAKLDPKNCLQSAIEPTLYSPIAGATLFESKEDIQQDINKMIGSSDMSKNDTIRPTSSSSPIGPPRVPTTASVAIPNSTRIRNPPPPSPLSKVSSSSPPTSNPTSIPPPSALAQSSSLGTSISPQNTSLKGLNIPLHSPCFIHSHLDKHGSLQDWLKSKSSAGSGHHLDQSTSLGNTSSSSSVGGQSSSTYKNNQNHHNHNHTQTHHVGNTIKPIRQPSYPTSKSTPPQGTHIPTKSSTHTPNHSLPTSPNGSKYTSPIMKDTGYDSDASSINGNGNSSFSKLSGSAILDGDLIDENEEAGSLTRQLAETAQGVREMSKELGRTKVRSRIQHVLIVTKARDNRLIKLTRELALYLMQKKPATSPNEHSRPGHEGRDRGMVVYVDAQLRTSRRFDAQGIQRDYPDLFKPLSRRRSSSSASVSTLGSLSAYPSTSNMSEFQKKSKDEGQLRYWTSEMCSSSPHLFDFVITLGGDGTVLFTSWLFQRIVPPVLPFALGSLGFLTNFDYAQYKQTMDKVVDEGIRVNLRMRFTCTVYRAIAPEEAALAASAKGGKKRKAIKKPGGEILMSHVDKSGWENLEAPPSQGSCSEVAGKDKEIMCFSTRPVEQFEVLNDLVVDRGPSPFVSLLELFGDEHHLTTVQADGLTVSTPTGSTAYSLSAGGSLVHPQIPALLITPICPHTLSFRPMLLPDSMELRICVPYNSRSTAWASFDGRGRVELKQGDHIKVTASKYPFPTVCADKASTDWFGSISRTLRWNEREKQKSFVVVEEDSEPSTDNKHHHRSNSTRKKHEEHNQVVHEENAPVHVEGKNRDDENLDEEEEDEDEEEEEEEEDDEEFDIDDKSGGENTQPSSQPSSPPIAPVNPPPHQANKIHSMIDHTHNHRNGLETPNRFMTPYEAPPPLSQRHLVEALSKAEIREKDNESGQRDNIREDGSAFRYNGKHGEHLIPPGRSTLTSPTEERENGQDESEAGDGETGDQFKDQKTPRPIMNSHHSHSHSQREDKVRIQSPSGHRHHQHSHHHHQHHQQRNEGGKGKAKAFAFFGQVC
uniref:NAD+ kinase n=1 Tax=Kwoniella pini CBS 10737 TaxID=1296096 RepID=A0A1B9I0S0_9TREE|nr:NAD+ kinase [Kwoniella pini CBS 10737]OCF49142.1 NAD+ kinase [Kwoniella pini CBS 10737]